jgi:hypothetical protein
MTVPILIKKAIKPGLHKPVNIDPVAGVCPFFLNKKSQANPDFKK